MGASCAANAVSVSNGRAWVLQGFDFPLRGAASVTNRSDRCGNVRQDVARRLASGFPRGNRFARLTRDIGVSDSGRTAPPGPAPASNIEDCFRSLQCDPTRSQCSQIACDRDSPRLFMPEDSTRPVVCVFHRSPQRHHLRLQCSPLASQFASPLFAFLVQVGGRRSWVNLTAPVRTPSGPI